MVGSSFKIESQNSLTADNFFNQFFLKVSDYQRPYVWTEKQVFKLYCDLLDYIEKEKVNSYPLYYLGTIILVQKENCETYDIIDGQQRISTLLLFAQLLQLNTGLNDNFSIESEISRINIKRNATFIKYHINRLKAENLNFHIDFSLINLTYIIADSQDQAFKFYTSLNTSGKRLDGIDIIKPFHLQALEKSKQIEKALALEHYQFDSSDANSSKLNRMAELLLKTRYWQGINFREFPRFNSSDWKARLPEEFAFEEMNGYEDIQYAEVKLSKGKETVSIPGYKVRQPLYKGENTIHYLIYYCEIWDAAEVKLKLQIIDKVKGLKGCDFNYEYYQMALITLISRYGKAFIEDDKFELIAALLFRVCFFTRLSKPVTKVSIYNFEHKYKLLDRIYYSDNPDEIITYCNMSRYRKLSIKKDDEGGVVGTFFNACISILKD